MGFDTWTISEGEEFSGGIWCLWNKDVWDVQVLRIHKQLIHCKVSWNKQEPWFLTAIYGSPNPTIRRDLWYMLEKIANLTIGPWCIGSNFNAIKSAQDSGGSSNLSSDTNKFIDCMCNCGMMEVEISGSPFTWQRGHIKRRLDRVLSSFKWAQLFQAAGVKHLSKLKSDHLPILIDFQHTIQDNSNKPFRLLAPWLLHDDYSNLVNDAWNPNDSLTDNINSFNNRAKAWNRETFENIFRKKSCIIARLEGINKSLSFQSNPFLEKLQKELCMEYENIVVQE
ncbi:uncharacterized protein LOC107471016 [Arachis duranensis]|uniref:Uncharacterized protein LOC107471016 n=1 Tax=Arachis duranensis TaxID=130453 RepID=A0A6P4BYP7_ARADU|nr:uncharacterized protein LOC107471016 [Arachis duranensis]